MSCADGPSATIILSSQPLPLYVSTAAWRNFLPSEISRERGVDTVGRNRGFTSTLIQIQRQAERNAKARAAAQRQAALAAERARKAYDRAAAADQKERARLYVESRVAEVAALNEALAADVAALDGLFREALATNGFLDFDSLKEAASRPPFAPGSLAVPEPPPDPATFRPPAPSGTQKLVPGARQRYEARFEEGRHKYEAALQAHQQRESERLSRLGLAQAEHERAVAELEDRLARQHAEVEAFKASFEAGQPDAVVEYFALALEHSHYPEGFPQGFRLAYVPESRQLVIQYRLPAFSIVPPVAEYKYVKAGDKITQKSPPQKERQELYKRVVAAVTVRTLYEIFSADQSQTAESVIFNGHVDTINEATGKQEYPCLVTLMAIRDSFMDRDFSRVEPLACLLDLSASVSKNPAELAPVRPVLEFDMVDPRFVEEADVLSGLDQRANLMELTPGEFESLITNLFTKMGLETRMTQASRDGGVDCVAFDNRPIFGGKVIIQAKRYKNTIPVSAVRDLFGSVHNEGASKGILVTTSGFGKASFDFAKDKPLELLSGSNLLYLLKVHADVDAKIEPPEHWVEPRNDIGPAHWDEPGNA
jgi:restriction system protein